MSLATLFSKACQAPKHEAKALQLRQRFFARAHFTKFELAITDCHQPEMLSHGAELDESVSTETLLNLSSDVTEIAGTPSPWHQARTPPDRVLQRAFQPPQLDRFPARCTADLGIDLAEIGELAQ
jgi:hypothetical protein